MKISTIMGLGMGLTLLGATTAQAQVAPTPAAAPEPVALVTDKASQPAASTDAMKVKAEINPVTKRLMVRTDITGPVRVEINDENGRPILTKDMIAGDKAVNIDVSRLAMGAYLVRCSSGERSGVRRVQLGQ